MQCFPEPVLLVSDIDGTLLTKDYHIPLRNIMAIRRFQQEGGLFTVATGRSIESGRDTLRQVRPNAPCIVLNGGMLCVFESKHTIWSHPLPLNAERFIWTLYHRFPTTAIELFSKSQIYLLQENGYSISHLKRSQVQGIPIINGILPRHIYKILLMDDVSVIQKIGCYLQEECPDFLRYFASSAHYLEIVPADVNKGCALRKLSKLSGVRSECTFAIGDYENDLELIQSASLSAAPANAIDEIKAAAALTVSDCSNGAVADFIEYIESMYHLHNV